LVATTRSPYGYVSGNPLNRTDPTGLFLGLPGDWCLKNPFDRADKRCHTGANDFRDWESPDPGHDYKTTSYGLGPASFNVTITRDGSSYFGGGVGPSEPLVNYSQANGDIMSSIGVKACESNANVDSFVNGWGVNENAYAGFGGGITASSIDGQHLDYATEYGVGTLQIGAQLQVNFDWLK